MTTLESPLDIPTGKVRRDGPAPSSAPTLPPASLRQRLAERASGLRAKLVVPYVLLTLTTAMIGMFVITRLVASTLRERFANQLLESSRAAADSVVRRERTQLEELRLMSFTVGVAQAVAEHDPEALQTILFPLMVNDGVQSLTIASDTGLEIISWVLDPDSGEYLISRGADLSGLELVARPLRGEEDALGDKFAGLASTLYGPYLLTSGPIRTGGGALAGVMLIGTRLDSLAGDIKSQVLADVVVLDPTGTVMSATLAEPDEGYGALALSANEVAYLDLGASREVELYGRVFHVYYAPLEVRQTPVGVMGVALPANFIVTTEATSRNVFSLVFSLGTVAVIVVGLLLATRISRPILRMRDVSLAVAAGDLDQRTGIRGNDEVGQMAAVFDLMTFRLRRRTAQAARLHSEAVRRSEELAEANTRLQQAQQQLIQSEKLAAVGQLAAGIVHDIKNPLAVISGLSEEMQETVGTESELATSLSQVRDNAVRASRILTDLLKFARQSNPELQYQNVWDTVQAAVRLNEYLARRGNVRVSIEENPAPILTLFDAAQLEQVLVNLIQNAVHAMPSGGTLRLAVRQAEPWVEVEIRDSGVGIPPKNLNRIFDPFFTTKPPGEGTGLGLSVSYGIIAQHQGRIDVVSEVGQGSAFTIRLPLRTPGDRPQVE